MKQDMEKAEMEKLLKTIEAHPLTKQIIAERAAETLVRRKEAAGKIEVLKKEREEVIPRLQSDIDAKEAKYLKAKAALDADLGELQKVKTALSSERNSFDTDIRNQEAILIQSADPAIDAAITFFQDKLDWLRSPGRISSRGMTVERNLITDTKTLTTETNEGGVLTALAYCQAAIKRLEALKLSPEFHIEGIQELKDALPSIEVYQEVSGEKPLPGSKGINPRHLLKSDSQLDWEMGKLNERFEKLMRK
jgi:Skp family chaperone for outer membrane proteins